MEWNTGESAKLSSDRATREKELKDVGCAEKIEPFVQWRKRGC